MTIYPFPDLNNSSPPTHTHIHQVPSAHQSPTGMICSCDSARLCTIVQATHNSLSSLFSIIGSRSIYTHPHNPTSKFIWQLSLLIYSAASVNSNLKEYADLLHYLLKDHCLKWIYFAVIQACNISYSYLHNKFIIPSDILILFLHPRNTFFVNSHMCTKYYYKVN